MISYKKQDLRRDFEGSFSSWTSVCSSAPSCAGWETSSAVVQRLLLVWLGVVAVSYEVIDRSDDMGGVIVFCEMVVWVVVDHLRNEFVEVAEWVEVVEWVEVIE